jgi:toxin ParE1/3/4
VKLTVVPAALAELKDTAAFYTARADARLGLAFVAEFERAANLVLANPEIGRIFRPDARRFVMRRFPYNVIYQVASGELRILAVAHQSRRPGYWAGRK